MLYIWNRFWDFVWIPICNIDKMPRICHARNCNNARGKQAGVSFYRLPSLSDSRRNQWMKIVCPGKASKVDNHKIQLCSEHFDILSFEQCYSVSMIYRVKVFLWQSSLHYTVNFSRASSKKKPKFCEMSYKLCSTFKWMKNRKMILHLFLFLH